AGLSSDGSVRGLLPAFRARVAPVGGADGSTVDVAVTVRASALELAVAPAIVHVGTFDVGEQAPLTFTVVNNGNWATTSSSATVTLPAQLVAALDSKTVGSTPGCAAAKDGRTVTCDLGPLDPGRPVPVQLNVRAVSSGLGEVAVALSSGNGPAATGTGRVVVSSGGFTPRFSTAGLKGSWNVTEIGAPLLTCPPSEKCTGALTGKGPTLNNNDFPMLPLLEKGFADAKVASSSQLRIPAGREVAFAGLYWAASAGSPTTQPVTARLAGPGQAFVAVTGSLLAHSGGTAGRGEYQAFADVTAQVETQVKDGGPGTWTFADPSSGVGSGSGAYAGWALVVVYADDAASAGTVVVHDGAVAVNVGSSASLTVATTPGQSARIGVVVWEGDLGASGDTFTLDGAALVPVRWPGTGTAPGDAKNAFDSTATGSHDANSLGVDAKGFLETVIAAPRAPAVAGSSVLTARSPNEGFVLGVVTVLTR
ncbi:MAG TPA: hypothetical protein VFC48_06760, partial [Cellulomonas sp.]|nr:hypothetical protein [Cellulomonas sp.]